jgi:hypothetical protein
MADAQKGFARARSIQKQHRSVPFGLNRATPSIAGPALSKELRR